MEPQAISLDVLRDKYAKGQEQTIEDVQRRVAAALASVEQDPAAWEGPFRDAMRAGFIPAGRIMSAAGAGISATLLNCFVQPVGDSVSVPDDEGRPGIYQALQQAAETMRRGGGVGYNFSAIRPKGAVVNGTASVASGPVSYMRVFDRSCETVESAGARRGAQMAVLNVEHPDIEEFVHAKDAAGELSNFNLSVGVSDAFMAAVETDAEWALVHQAEPSASLKAAGAYRRDEGRWVFRVVRARELWDQIIRSTYDHAEPGVLFLDHIERENNLGYCESISATNPCGEQPLPAYGACCLGSIDVTRFVGAPFTDHQHFDREGFVRVVAVAIRMLDNVLDLTVWPLPEQEREARAKRRVGLGFTGLGDALVMMGLRYDTEAARSFASMVAREMRDAAYAASIDLASEKGAFALFDAEQYLASGFASRLEEGTRNAIRRHGLRNSHLLSIAPTGTISLAFADNASNGIEPPFSWTYTRTKREADGSRKRYVVEDHAFRLFREMGGAVEDLPARFVTALEISALDHVRMLEAVQPYIDTSISKTVNVPEDYPFEDFRCLYAEAWRAGLKGLATYRPNNVTGAVLEAPATAATSAPAVAASQDLDDSDPDRRIRLDGVPKPALASLRWRKRPHLPAGNPSWTYTVRHPNGCDFAVMVGHIENGSKHPFEVWVNGAEQPRGLGALAKSLSMDMRSQDRGWLTAKLDSLSRASGEDAFDLVMPPDGKLLRVPSMVAGFARIVRYHCERLGVFEEAGETPVLDALMSRKEPKTGTGGTLSWTVDVLNPATGDDFVLGLKELVLPDGSRRPYSVWLAGEYPRALDGLAKSLSLDLRVIDPAWAGAKLRQLRDFSEPRGDFLAWVPGEKRQASYPSTVAYLSALLLHRFAVLGILDEQGFPVAPMGIMEVEENVVTLPRRSVGAMEASHVAGKLCGECGTYAVIRQDGCDFCTSCGEKGACG